MYQHPSWQMLKFRKSKTKKWRRKKERRCGGGDEPDSLLHVTLFSPLLYNRAKLKVLDMNPRAFLHGWVLTSSIALAMQLIPVTFSIMIIPQRKLKLFLKTRSKELHRRLQTPFRNITAVFVTVSNTWVWYDSFPLQARLFVSKRSHSLERFFPFLGSLYLHRLCYLFFSSMYSSFEIETYLKRGTMHLFVLQEVLELKEQLILHWEMTLYFKHNKWGSALRVTRISTRVLMRTFPQSMGAHKDLVHLRWSQRLTPVQ